MTKLTISGVRHWLKRRTMATYYSARRAASPDAYFVNWDTEKNNFGDVLTPILISHFTDRKLVRVTHPNFCAHTNYLVIGSILDRAAENTVVWGSGFISADSRCLSVPKQVRAVRGPRTRELLLRQGVHCPEVYGDPALLLPLFYNPATPKRYKVGVVPHYADKNATWVKRVKREPGVCVIDIQNSNPMQVIDQMCQCEHIASSSLHGLIIADAYGIPSLWIELSNRVFGGGFKFIDYFMSIDSTHRQPLIVAPQTPVAELIERSSLRPVNIDLQALLNCCPFSQE